MRQDYFDELDCVCKNVDPLTGSSEKCVCKTRDFDEITINTLDIELPKSKGK